MSKITYIFSSGRLSKIKSNNIEALDFFYGYFYFKKKGYQLEIIEFSKANKFLYFFDKLINKFISLPFNTSQLTNFKNFQKIRNTDHLVLVNEKVFCSSFFLLIFLKLFNRKATVSVFIMGLYSKHIKYKFFKSLHFLIIKTLYMLTDSLIFLGEGEYNKANSLHLNSKKLYLLPFAVDTNFWNSDYVYDAKKRDGILFIGNDGNRNYELLKEIVINNKNLNFSIVSNNPTFSSLELSNLNFIKGSWSEEVLSDLQIKKFYESSRLVILPLKESLQPSGQSVCLQALNCGVPVAITDTEGFWDKDSFIDNVNIFLIKGHSISDWARVFEDLYFDFDKLDKISKQAKATVLESSNYQKFCDKIFDIVTKK